MVLSQVSIAIGTSWANKYKQAGAYGLVGHDVVDVVAALPPADGQTAAKVTNKQPKQCVKDEILGDGAMPGIVCSEHDLMLVANKSEDINYYRASQEIGAYMTYPKETQEDGRCHVPLLTQGEEEHDEERRIANHLLAVLDIATLVQPFIFDLLMELSVLVDDVLLHRDIVRAGIIAMVLGDALLNCPVCVLDRTVRQCLGRIHVAAVGSGALGGTVSKIGT